MVQDVCLHEYDTVVCTKRSKTRGHVGIQPEGFQQQQMVFMFNSQPKQGKLVLKLSLVRITAGDVYPYIIYSTKHLSPLFYFPAGANYPSLYLHRVRVCLFMPRRPLCTRDLLDNIT